MDKQNALRGAPVAVGKGRSKRERGRVLRRDDDHVYIEFEDGSAGSYPIDVVRLRRPDSTNDVTVHVGATEAQRKAWRRAARANRCSLSKWAATVLDEKAASFAGK